MADLSENFISYNPELFFKNERIQDQEFSLDNSESEDTDSTLYPQTGYFIHPNLMSYLQDSRFQIPTNNYEKIFNPNQPFNIIKVKKEEYDESIDVKVEECEGISSKSKRILKREKAKQRTKCKQDTTSFLSQVNSKYIPEGFDDPSIDDKTKKKMIQMIRNRISAQNSRDRKKAYMLELEILKQRLHDENRKVYHEKEDLYNQIRTLQDYNNRLIKENLDLKKKHVDPCLHCGKSLQVTSPSVDFTADSTDDFSLENVSLSSPSNISRSHPNKNFMAYAFAFATILACVMMNMNNNQAPIGIPGSNSLPGPRMLAQTSNSLVEKKDQPPCLRLSDISPTSVMLNNIKPLKKEFNEHHLALFQSELEKNKIIGNPTFSSIDAKIKIEEPETALMDYRSSGFLSAKEPKLPILDLRQGGLRHDTSSLLCPYGIQMFDGEEQKQENDMEDENEARFGKLGSSKFLQLWIPKRSLNKIDLKDMTQELPDDSQNDNSILELWCNVYFVRELSANM
jgi:hypothetical protein